MNEWCLGLFHRNCPSFSGGENLTTMSSRDDCTEISRERENLKPGRTGHTFDVRDKLKPCVILHFIEKNLGLNQKVRLHPCMKKTKTKFVK